LTSKPRPNSEPALSFSFLCQLGTIGEGRGTCCPSPARATARMKFIFSLGAVALSLAHCPPARDPSAPARLSLSRHATCHGGVSVTSLRYAGSAGLCPTPRGWARRSPVALTLTRLTLPSAYPRFGCWSSLCPVSLLTKEPNRMCIDRYGTRRVGNPVHSPDG
jgi:hypothetical protein